MGSIGLAFLAAVTYGASDFMGGYASRRVDPLRVVLWSQLVGLTIGVVIVPVVGGTIALPDILRGAAAGLAGLLGLVSLYRGLSVGRAAIVAPLSGVLSATVPVAAGLAGGERPEIVTAAGFVVAVVAVWLVSGGRLEAGSGFGLGILAGAGFGLFFVLLAPIPASAGLWPLIPARLVSIAALAALLRGRIGARAGRATWRLVAAVGAGDMAANVLVLLALQRGPLGEGAVVSSLYPAFTVLLAAVVAKEHVRWTQWGGIALAVVAMSLIAA